MVSQTGSSTSNDDVVLAALGGLFAIAAVVWAGAAAACAVVGHGRLRAGLGQAAAALFKLPAHARDPRRAWPAAAAEQLPGPVLYWLATGIVLAAAVLAARGLWKLWKGFGGKSRRRLGVDVAARFATVNDLAPLVVTEPIPGGRFVLGRVNGRLVATEDARLSPMATRRPAARVRQGDRGSVAIIGPSRSGKTANVIAGLRDWAGPAVVVSVKTDLMDASLPARRERGEVLVFDPSGIAGDRAPLCRWSPLRAAGTPTGATKAAAALAAAIPRSGVEGGGDYWVAQAEILLTGLLAAAALDGSMTMTDVARWVFIKDMPIEKGPPSEVFELLARYGDDGTPEEADRAEWAATQLDAIWRLEDKMRSSVYGTVQTGVRSWLEPIVAESCRPFDSETGEVMPFVDLDWLNAASNTLYVVAPLDDQKRLAPVLGGIIGDIKDQTYQWDATGRKLRAPLLLVIDEAANMPLSWLPEVVSTCAGIGVLLVTVWQSKSQLDAAYGRLADSVLTNHLTKIVFSGCSDLSTLDYVTRLCGEEEIQKRTVSTDRSGGTKRRTVSEAPQREPLTPLHLLRQVEPGQAILIHGTLPPAHLHTRRYWTERPLTTAEVADPSVAEVVT